MTLVLDTTTAIKALEQAVAERGREYVYPDIPLEPESQYDDTKCVYVHDDAPSCLIGLALYNLGVPLASMGGRRNSAGASSLLEALAEAGLIEFPDEDVAEAVKHFYNTTQGRQDVKDTWGAALDQGEDDLREYYLDAGEDYV